MAHLYLLGVLRQVVLPLPGLLHETSIPTLLHLLLVLQRCHLLRLVLHLPIGTPWHTCEKLHVMYTFDYGNIIYHFNLKKMVKWGKAQISYILNTSMH